MDVKMLYLGKGWECFFSTEIIRIPGHSTALPYTVLDKRKLPFFVVNRFSILNNRLYQIDSRVIRYIVD